MISFKNKSFVRLLVIFTILLGATESSAFNLKNMFSSKARRIAIPTQSSCVPSRGMWLWTTKALLSNEGEQDLLVSVSLSSHVTDIYAYVVAADYSRYQPQLRAFNAKLNSAGIQVWGMEGYRGYFSDSYGPAGFYAAADALIAFNSRVAVHERFVGFHSDMEPQDGQGEEFRPIFHNNLKDSRLNSVSGGVWYASQAEDREMLMRDWLQITQTIQQKMAAAGLRLGAAMPSWTDDYYGEEVLVTYNGIRQGVTKHMMSLVNDYVVMSYNTNPANAANRIAGKLAYADTLPIAMRPRVFGSLETHVGVGSTISYADTRGKSSKAAVLQDIQIIQGILGNYHSFCGINLHDWVGWRDLSL